MTKIYINTDDNSQPYYFFDIKLKEGIETEDQIPEKYKEIVDGGFDSEYNPEDHYFIFSAPQLVDGVWTRYKQVRIIPPPPKVTVRQARRALLEIGLLDDVEAAINNIPDELTRKKVKIDWEYASEVERSSEFVNLISTSLNMTKEQIDGLFKLANKF